MKSYHDSDQFTFESKLAGWLAATEAAIPFPSSLPTLLIDK